MGDRNNKTKELIRDIVEWDTKNWWRAIEFWGINEEKSLKGKKVLDIGGRNGGLSLYWALRGADVICSDLNESGFEQAKKLQKKYGVEKRVSYERIDATKIPYKGEFDIICFKSVLGGVGYNDNYDNQKQMMKSIYTALTDSGKLYFCENLYASPLHHYLRKRYMKWGDQWRYIHLKEIPDLTEEFRKVESSTFGFCGVFGRRPFLADLMGTVDIWFDRWIKDENRYIVSCICSK